MPQCPICSHSVADQRGLAAHFRHQADTHPDYKQWKADQRWAGKVEGEDYVVCLECGHRAASLARHLKASHGITANEYRARYGDVLIRPTKVTAKRSKAIRERGGGFGKGETKEVTCLVCGAVWRGSKFLVPGTHDLRCEACREAADEAVWASQTEGVDYVVCLDCGHRAENLTSHIQVAHPGYRDDYPDAPIVALDSAVRDKTALQGRRLSDETRQKMSKNAGRWNKGLTKETHPSMARISEKRMGQPSWSKGLTAADDPRLVETARKLRFYVGENRPWDNGQAVNLTLADFEPFMDGRGCVDHHKVIEATGISWVTVRKYIVDLGLAQSRRYVEDAADDRTIRLDKGTLEGFQLGNGKVSIGKAMSVTGHAFKVIKRECLRHGLPTFHRHIRQTLCLDAVSEALGGEPYQSEWESKRFTNPPTGRRFRFDGYFPDLGLIVEFQGHQHYTFPNAFMIDESYRPNWEAMVERDRVKREMIQAAPDLIWFEVRGDEPFRDVSYLRGRLVEVLGYPVA